MYPTKWLTLIIFLSTAGCQRGFQIFHYPTAGNNPQAIPLSLSIPGLKSCQYGGHTRIAHFPMFHYPPTGFAGDQTVFEQVSKSQFQLLHTIMAYKPSIAVFSEDVASDYYNTQTYSHLKQNIDETEFELLDGTRFKLQKRYNTAWHIFPRSVPQYYERLAPSQKDFLAYTGGSKTAWLLGQILHIYKTISEQDRLAFIANLNRISQLRYQGNLELLFNTPENSDPERDWWLLHFREQKLKQEVDAFYRQNPSFSGLILIAYGVNHKLHNEFPVGFSDGSFCLAWNLF